MLHISNYETVFLYPAFVEALLNILNHVKKAKSTNKFILLYHGVSGVGKSMLAAALCYFLGIWKKRSSLVTFSHHSECNGDRLEDRVIVYGDIHSEVLILDQLNPDKFSVEPFLAHCYTYRKNHLPVLIFTSGYYFPSSSLIKSPLMYKAVLHLAINEDVVKQMDVPYANDPDVARQILKHNNVYGRVRDNLLRYNSAKESIQDFLEEECEMALNELISEEMRPCIYVLWGSYLEKELPEFDEVSPSLFEMTRDNFEILQHYMTKKQKNPANKGFNAINWLVPEGENKCVNEKEFALYSFNSVHFIFTNKPALYNCFKSFTSTKKFMYEHCRQMFNELKGNLDQSLKSLCLKQMVKWYCEHRKCGLFANLYQQKFDSIMVEEVVNVFGISELIQHLSCKMSQCKVWVSLDKQGQTSFTEYDFVYAVGDFNHTTGSFLIQNMQLIQVSVNPRGKSLYKKSVMIKQLHCIQNALVKDHCIEPENIDCVSPVFAVPFSQDGSTVKNTITIFSKQEHKASNNDGDYNDDIDNNDDDDYDDDNDGINYDEDLLKLPFQNKIEVPVCNLIKFEAFD